MGMVSRTHWQGLLWMAELRQMLVVSQKKGLAIILGMPLGGINNLSDAPLT